AGDGLLVGRRPRVLVHAQQQGVEQHDQQQDAQQPLHPGPPSLTPSTAAPGTTAPAGAAARGAPPVASRMTTSSLSAARGSSPARRPSCSPRTRALTPRSSSRALEIIR